MTGGIRRTRKAWNIDWMAHCLTFSCYQRRRFFTGQVAPAWFQEALLRAKDCAPFDLWAYVIMPEHVHVVLLPHEQVRIEDILWQMKRPFARRVVAWVRRHSPGFLDRMADVQGGGRVVHRFWQPGGGYDRNLRSVRDVHEKVQYIHENPVRRGLVDKVEDWAWSSAREWTTGQVGTVPMDMASVPILVV